MVEAPMSAVISPCGRFRYRLERHALSGAGAVAWIMVNPSTADATEDDATIRKVRGFSERLGAGWFIVGNLFAYRSTDVRQLAKAADPIGPDNDDHLRAIIADAPVVIVAWGPTAKLPASLRRRFYRVARIAEEAGRELLCLGTAKDGQPLHPLMQPYSAELRPWRVP